MRRIVQQGYCLHLVIEDASPEAVALVEAILAADQVMRKEGVTEADVSAAWMAIMDAEKLWCRAHGVKHVRTMHMALAYLSRRLRIVEARHATA